MRIFTMGIKGLILNHINISRTVSIFFICILSGCIRSTPEMDPFKDLDAVLKVGMTQDDVVAILGKPSEIRGNESFTVLVYEVDSWPKVGQSLEKSYKYMKVLNGYEWAIFEYTIHIRYNKYEKYDFSGIARGYKSHPGGQDP